MTRSRRLSGKPTAKQNQQSIAALERHVNELTQAVSMDIGRANGLLFGILKQLDLVDEYDCRHCGQAIVEPKLDALPPMENCPACGKPLQEDLVKITDVEAWDSGGEEE